MSVLFLLPSEFPPHFHQGPNPDLEPCKRGVLGNIVPAKLSSHSPEPPQLSNVTWYWDINHILYKKGSINK